HECADQEAQASPSPYVRFSHILTSGARPSQSHTDPHSSDITNTVTELPPSSIRSSPSPAPSLGEDKELAPAVSPDDSAAAAGPPAAAAAPPAPLHGTSAGSGVAGTPCVALFPSFDAPSACEAESTAKPSGIDNVTGFPPTEAASLALSTVVTRVRPSSFETG